MKTKFDNGILTDDEIVEAMVLPVELSAGEKDEADKELMTARLSRRRSLEKDELKRYELRKLRFQLEQYINADQFQPEKHFGFFLKQYIKVTNKKQKEFASDIDVHPTTVTNLINNVKKPNDKLIIRLEIHSGNTIPAIDWFKLNEMEKGYEIMTSQRLREEESKFVKGRIEFAH